MASNKIISFLVSGDYTNPRLDSIFSKNDTNINEEIIHYGILIYDCVQNKKLQEYQIQDIKSSLEKDYKINIELSNNENVILKNDCKKYQEQICILTQNIDHLTNEKYNYSCEFLEKGKQITKDEYQTILSMQTEQKNKLELELHNKDETIKNLQQQLLESVKNREEQNIKIIDDNISQLNDKFSNYFNKIFTVNSEKGDYGEDFVQNYLIDKFSGATIIDTHKETATGDIIFHFNNLKTLIEVKNVQQVKPIEIEKFYRDIQVKKDEINSALFISLNDTNLIKGQKNIHFEIKHNIPIFMLSNSFNNPENIRLAIVIIQYLISHNFIFDNKKKSKEEIDENKQQLQLLITAINEIFEYIQLQKSSLTNDFILVQKMQESFKKRDSQINNIDIVINGIFRQYPQLYISSNKKNEKTEEATATISKNDNIENNYEMKKTIHAIINHIKDKNITSFNHTMINIKLLKYLLVSDGCIRNLGGIKEIKLAYLKFTKGNTNATEIIQIANTQQQQQQQTIQQKKEPAMEKK
jgi:hypothetical protein